MNIYHNKGKEIGNLSEINIKRTKQRKHVRLIQVRQKAERGTGIIIKTHVVQKLKK